MSNGSKRLWRAKVRLLPGSRRTRSESFRLIIRLGSQARNQTFQTLKNQLTYNEQTPRVQLKNIPYTISIWPTSSLPSYYLNGLQTKELKTFQLYRLCMRGMHRLPATNHDANNTDFWISPKPCRHSLRKVGVEESKQGFAKTDQTMEVEGGEEQQDKAKLVKQLEIEAAKTERARLEAKTRSSKQEKRFVRLLQLTTARSSY
jgi:hypothetical protein